MQILDRMLRASKLDPQLYEEVEADKSSMGQAVTVVGLGSLATGLGSFIEGGWLGLLMGVGVGLAGWAIWAWMNYFIGTRFFKETDTEADWGQLARTMGFAYSPRILVLLALIPIPALRALIYVVVVIWTWAAMIVGVRQALDYKNTLRAAGVTIIGAVLNAVILVLLQVVFIGKIT